MNTKLKSLLKAAALVVVSAWFIGCGREKPVVDDNRTVSGEEVKDKIGAAVTATKQYASETKDQAVAAVQKAIDDMDAKINQLAEKSAKYTDQAKTEAEEALTKLKAQRAVVEQKFEELKAASKDAWQEVKTGFDEAWQKLEDSYEQAQRKFTD